MKTLGFVSLRLGIIVGALALVVLFSLSFATPVYAAPITVNTLADNLTTDTFCSLREAIGNANDDAATYPDCAAGSGTDTITFSVSGNITLSSVLGHLAVTQIGAGNELIINGGGNIQVTGNNATRVFYVGSPVSNDLDPRALTLQNIVVRNGNAGGGGLILGATRAEGGCIFVAPDSILTLENTTVQSCRSSTDGGGIYADGGGSGSTTGSVINMSNATIQNNQANIGAGVFSRTGRTVADDDTCFFLNTATSLGGGYYGGDDTWLTAGGGSSSNRAFFIRNTAGTGGALYLETNSSFDGDHARFYGNNATTGSAFFSTGGSTGSLLGSPGRSCENCCIVNNTGLYAVYQPVSGDDTDWRNNWWGDDWGPLIYDLDNGFDVDPDGDFSPQSGSPGIGSNVSNGDGIYYDYFGDPNVYPDPANNAGVSAVNVGPIDFSDWDGIPTGAWNVQTNAPSDCQTNVCTGVSSVGQSRTCAAPLTCAAARGQ